MKLLIINAIRLILSRKRQRNAQEEEIGLIQAIIGGIIGVVLTVALVIYIIMNPIEVLKLSPKERPIVEKIKENAGGILGGDDFSGDVYEAQTSLSEEELAELMKNPELAEKIKIALAFCDDKVKRKIPYSQNLRATGKAYDCSSLMWYAYREAGIYLNNTKKYSDWPPTAAGIGKWCVNNKCVVDYDAIQPGDLLFFRRARAVAENRYMGIGHIAMYAGKGQIVHASSTKYGIRYSPSHKRELVLVARPIITVN